MLAPHAKSAGQSNPCAFKTQLRMKGGSGYIGGLGRTAKGEC
jgi:hypothetical protein